MQSAMLFEVEARDAASSARAGRLTLPHGGVETPVFMPVGTHGTVKAMTPEELSGMGVEMVLANTYHLGNHWRKNPRGGYRFGNFFALTDCFSCVHHSFFNSPVS